MTKMTKQPKTYSYRTLPPGKKFKGPDFPNIEKMLPERDQRTVTRGYIGGDDTNGRSQP